MRLITRYRQLSSAERSLFFQALALVTIIRIGLRLLPFRVMRNWVEHFRKSPGLRSDLDYRNIRQVAWAVEAASRRIPGTTCLPQGMATHLLLGRLGQPSELRLGVALKPEGQLEAHAWVEVQGRVVSGGAIEKFHRFVPLQEQSS
jgi:Transglutaminase-like superfamily